MLILQIICIFYLNMQFLFIPLDKTIYLTYNATTKQ